MGLPVIARGQHYGEVIATVPTAYPDCLSEHPTPPFLVIAFPLHCFLKSWDVSFSILNSIWSIPHLIVMNLYKCGILLP